MKRFPVLTVIIAAALIAAAFLLLERFRSTEKPEPPEEGRKEYTAPKEHISPMPPEKKPYRQVAIIIDDIGFDMRALKKLAEIPAPIAFAVLPHTPHAAEAAGFLYQGKREILLHLPMEPLSYPKQSPGAGALMADMNEAQILRQLNENFAAVPHASGVNNHMGSRFMEDALRLKTVMEELKKRNLYFVDSRTSPRSRGREAAAEAGVRFAARDIFIDHENGYESTLATLRQAAARKTKADGKPLLLIGHPHADTIRAIEDVLPLWEKEGIQIVELSRCLGNPK
ncbi:MAG: divergent polysaccharide deacetylase family protein [Syntrophobacterales bacterium]|nr:divergent polysaccharide deacetylase family protein [Syntrophobacterales bacterium]